jgi:hypothetical protein
VNGIIHVLEMAAGQLWRVVLDSWGIAGIGLVAALLVIVRRDVRSDVRIMGALTVAVITLIACMAPAALPLRQAQAWASGRYLDGMIVVFFLVGAAVLLRARDAGHRGLCRRLHRAFPAGRGDGGRLYRDDGADERVRRRVQLRRAGRGHPILDDASVALATAVTLVLLAVWIGFAFVLRRLRPGRAFGAVSAAFGVCVAAVSLVAVAQMTSHISQAGGSNTQEAIALMEAGKVRPGDQVAVAPSLGWMLTVPQAFEVSWIELKHFKPWPAVAARRHDRGRDGVAAGKPAEAGWPNAPAGWRIVASDQDVGWVVWRKG